MPSARPQHVPPREGEAVSTTGYIMKPCSWCGGPKPTDGSAWKRHVCSDACAAAAYRARKGPKNPPCVRCGRPKSKRAGVRAKICGRCRANDAAFQRARSRKRKKRPTRMVPTAPVVAWIDELGYDKTTVARLLAAGGEPWSSPASAARQIRTMRNETKTVSDRNVELIGIRLAGEPDLTAKLFPELVESWIEEMAA